jgi:thiol-disulfide isomerase/thioredoxin
MNNRSVILIIGLAILYIFGKYLWSRPSVTPNVTAPELVSTMPDGKSFKLSSLKGNYILLDFWGSWCGPCIAEMPEVKSIYSEFHNKKFKNATGFEIVSVGLETNHDSWTNAIKRLDMNWPYHISEIKRMKDPAAKAYGVREIPTKFLIGPDGVVIETNPSFEEIRRLLTSY